MKYLQEVEKELPDGDFVDFLNVIEDFKNNRCSLPPHLSRHHPIMLTTKKKAIPTPAFLLLHFVFDWLNRVRNNFVWVGHGVLFHLVFYYSGSRRHSLCSGSKKFYPASHRSSSGASTCSCHPSTTSSLLSASQDAPPPSPSPMGMRACTHTQHYARMYA